MLAQHYIGSYLDTGSKEMLIDRAKTLMISLKKRRKRGHVDWIFSISQKQPLTFKITELDNLKVQIDVSCEIIGCGDDIKKQNLLLRIWSCDENICYRSHMDASELRDKLEGAGWKRVMLRFHIDLKDSGAKIPEPWYHLHTGGDSEDSEYCWIPKEIKAPRFPYPPMDLILLCEFVIVNFFPQKSEDLRKNPEWQSLVRKSQEIFQRDYFARCMKCLDSGTDTLLENLLANTE